MPWRQTKNPYHIWISEIIMQQTRIDQGTPYYLRFIHRFPDIQQLASADEEEVLHLWQGLGYYSRARNLHHTARVVANRYNGEFPRSYAAIRELKGIGDYTAAAIASICFDHPHPVLDGNVIRFLSRYHGIDEPTDQPSVKRRILDIAGALIDQNQPGEFNQAVMEFGALVCTPLQPGCLECIFQTECVAYSRDLVQTIPRRNAKPVARNRYFHYLVLTAADGPEKYIYLRKRTGPDIWKNLYDFPMMELSEDDNHETSPHELFAGMLPARAKFEGLSETYRHILSHQKLFVKFYRFRVDLSEDLHFQPVPMGEISRYPVPRLIRRYLDASADLRQDDLYLSPQV